MNVYFISGLGADEKMFQRIKLPKGFRAVHLNWVDPFKKETFEAYALRLSQRIDRLEDFVLVGMSLGGMIAVEMDKFLSPKMTVLISSAVNKRTLPFWFKLSGWLGIPFITPNWFYRHNNFFSNWLLGAKSAEDKALLKATMRNASPKFVRWAVPRIICWKNTFIPSKIIHLHGTKDVILPYKKGKNIIPIEGGTHFMVFNRALEINQILDRTLSRLYPDRS